MSETNKAIIPDSFEEVTIDVSEGNFCAYDMNGKLVYADEAIKKVDYLCPICRECRMRVHRIPNSEKNIFAKKPNEVHTRSECYQATDAKKKKKNIPTPRSTNFSELIDKLCHVPAPGKGGGGGGGGGRRGGDGPDPEIHEVGFSTLKQLNAFLLTAVKPEESLIDNVWNYTWLSKDLVENFTYGSKIISARFISAYDNNILLVMYFGDASIRIRITFRDKSDYFSTRKMIYKIKEDNQYLINRKTVYPDVNLLIASNRWKLVTDEECNSSICVDQNYCENCLGYYKTMIFRKNQVYPYLVPRTAN